MANKRANYKRNNQKGSNQKRPQKRSCNNEQMQDSKENANVSEQPANNPLYFIPSDQAGLLESLTSFSFPQVMGESRSIKPAFDHHSGRVDITLPTASRILVSPTLGPVPSTGGAALNAAPINVAATSTFVALSALNNKTTQYAPQDVQLMVLAVGQIYAVEEFIRRAFKFSFLIDSRNLAVPRTYFTAMGVDFDDYRSQIANYRDQFNVLITKINSIRFMYNIPYLKKCYEIFQGAYRDAMTDLYGMHFVVPGTTWRLNDIKNEQGGGLDTVTVVPHTGTRPMSEYLALLDELVTAVRTSSTFNVIYSDILALYDRSGFETLTLPLYSVAEMIEEEYNPMFNIMLRHATVMGYNLPDTDPEAPAKYQTQKNDVVSDPENNSLYIQYGFDQATDYVAYDRLVNFFETNSPDAATRFEMTRWMVIGDATGQQSTSGVRSFRCTDPILQDTVVNGVVLFIGNTIVHQLLGNVYTTSDDATMASIARYAKMANLPMLVYADVDEDNAITQAHYLGDIDAWSSVDKQYLQNLAKQTMIYYFGSI